MLRLLVLVHVLDGLERLELVLAGARRHVFGLVMACPEHGEHVSVDEDGCCLTCGRDCHPYAPVDITGVGGAA